MLLDVPLKDPACGAVFARNLPVGMEVCAIAMIGSAARANAMSATSIRVIGYPAILLVVPLKLPALGPDFLTKITLCAARHALISSSSRNVFMVTHPFIVDVVPLNEPALSPGASE